MQQKGFGAGRWSEILDRKRQCNAAISSRDSLPAMYYQTPTKTRHQRTDRPGCWECQTKSISVSKLALSTRRHGEGLRAVGWTVWPPCVRASRNMGTALLICRCYRRMQIVRARLQKWLKARQPQACFSCRCNARCITSIQNVFLGLFRYQKSFVQTIS
jgi:hypothetical protein